MYLDALEYGFITGFEKYLKIEAGIDHNTAMSYIKRLKRIISISVNNHWLSFNPFSAIKCTTRKVVREELTEEEVKRLLEKVFAVKRLEEVRDCFLFSCYTGYAFVDACKLSMANIASTMRKLVLRAGLCMYKNFLYFFKVYGLVQKICNVRVFRRSVNVAV